MRSGIGRIIVDYLSVLLVALSGIGFAFVGILLNSGPQTEGVRSFLLSWPGLIFSLAAVFIVVGSLLGAGQIRELRTLRTRLEELEQRELDYPAHLAAELKLILEDTWGYGATERISVYRRSEDAFQMIGRFSKNPDYTEPGRSVYPANQGVIGEAWSAAEGTAVADLPDWQTAPERYYEVLEDTWAIDRDTAEHLTMKSRSLAACAIDDPKGVKRVAIVVVESTEVGILDKSKVLKELRGKEGKRIYEFLEKMRQEEPDLGDARERGF